MINILHTMVGIGIYDLIKFIIMKLIRSKTTILNNRIEVSQEQIAKFADPLRAYSKYKDKYTKLYKIFKPEKPNRREVT